jgi:hypothetical protein
MEVILLESKFFKKMSQYMREKECTAEEINADDYMQWIEDRGEIFPTQEEMNILQEIYG